MGISMSHILVVVVLFILLFGRGKIPQLMTDLAEGIKNFKHGIKDNHDDDEHDVASRKNVRNEKADV